MKLVLKILALPVLFVVKVICVLGNLLTNVVSYVIGILLLVIGGSAIYCIVKALWQSLLILVVLGIATIAAVFLLVWAVMKAENIGESLGAFILVGLGMWLICDSDDGAKEVINHPEKIDIDNSRIIEPVEAIITGFALSVDSVSVCLGYGAAGKNSVVLPVLVTVFQIIFLYGGIIMSKKIRLKTKVNCITLISGLIIMIIGLYKLVPFFS